MSWHSFKHEAMATYFEVAIAGADETYARQAATAVFREVDRLEAELSRFVTSSDIARVNRLGMGESAVVGVDAFECLLCAADVWLATNGAFDAAFATSRAPGEPAFELDAANHRVGAGVGSLRLDLGAIGKGYALDVGANLLREWKIDAACLVAGGSTVVALNPPPSADGWRIGIGDGPAMQPFWLAHRAISASGTAVKGAHLVDPRTRTPAKRSGRVWALAASGAQSDALSTAFFVMTDEEIGRFCAAHPAIGAAVTTAEGQLLKFGAMQE